MEDDAHLTSERAKARSIEAIGRRDRDGEPVREIVRSYNVGHSTISRLIRYLVPAFAGAG